MTLAELRSDAVRLSIAELIAAVHSAAGAFASAASALGDGASGDPVALARAGMDLGISVAREVLHVSLTGELPEDDDSTSPMALAALAESYVQAIESCIAHVEAADPEAFLDVSWVHPDYGSLNWREWFAFLAYDARARVAGIPGGR